MTLHLIMISLEEKLNHNVQVLSHNYETIHTILLFPFSVTELWLHTPLPD